MSLLCCNQWLECIPHCASVSQYEITWGWTRTGTVHYSFARLQIRQGTWKDFACCSWGKQCLFTTPCFIQLVLHLHEFSPEFPSCVPRWLTFSAWVELRSNQNTEVNRRYKWFPLCLWLDMVALWDSTESVFMMLLALSDLSTLLLLVWRALLMLRGRLYLQWRLWSHHMWHSKRFWIRVISGCWWYWTITGIHRAHVPT